MKFKLSEILKSTILSEGRKEDAMKRFGASEEIVNTLSQGDPSGNNKYLLWMTKQVMESGADDLAFMANVIIDAVRRYHEQVNRLNKEIASQAGVSSKAQNNPKDINVYANVNELLKIVKQSEQQVVDREIKKEADKVYEDKNVLVVSPLTVRASCKYGAGTRWCITSRSGDNYNTHFDSYTKDAVFYFITDKTTTQTESPTHYKYALQYSHTGSMTWWDASDSSHSEPPSFMKTTSGKKAMAAINNYHKKAVGDKLTRMVQKFILQPMSKDYRTYAQHLNDDEKKQVIDKIIRQEGATVSVLEALIDDLTDRQKDSLLHNLTNLNYSSFNKIKKQLNITQLINVIINNPTVLNNSEAINYVDNKLTEEQKYQLANKIDKKLVNNTDSTVVLRGWSMSPEQKASLNKTSFYMMVEEDGEIKDVVKVIPTDPESYRVINGLKLRATIDKSVTIYAIKTEANLLDEYVGGKPMSIETQEKIKAKAQKVST